ncbi:Yfh7p [Sporobolomyces koalae]|uniref:Yfh7p n=1 Tax=Sporobolomyces koalae TaxID=500713 RepID=UPI00317716D6
MGKRKVRLDGPVRILVGIAGAPGSGKSTLAYPLVEYINASTAQTVSSQHMAQEPTAIAVGLDGWHHSRAELDAFPDPVEARRRRGAAFTFNALDYVAFVRALRSIPAVPQVTFPIFSHAVKDPTPSPSPILPNHKIVIIEGLYTLLDIEPWSEATDELDLRIWVECDRKVARERLIARHLESGIEPDRQAAEIRVDGSDMVNGEFVREHLVEPTLRVDSADDPAFAASHKQ